MITVLVGHVKKPNFGMGPTPTYPEDYTLVASVEVPADARREDALDFCYEKTNTIHKLWWENSGVSLLVKGGARSTSVGDVMVFPDGKVFCCVAVGWEEIVGSFA